MMSENKIKHIAALGAWAALHVYYLAFHFTWSNFALFAIALIFLFYTTVVGKEHDESHVVETLGNLLGTSFAVLLGYYITTAMVPAFEIPVNANFSEIILSIFEQLVQKIKSTEFEISFWESSSYVLLIAAVVMFFGSKSSKYPVLGILFKYLWTGCVFAALINANYQSVGLLLLYMACTLLFVACDILNYQHDGNQGKIGKRWYNILNFLLLLALLLQPDTLTPFTQKGFIEYYFLMCGFKWYTALYILIVFGVAGIFMMVGYNETEAKSKTDIFVFWNAICVLITTFFISRFYVGYWWGVTILYGIGVTVVVTLLIPTKVKDDVEWKRLSFVLLPIISLATIVTVVSGHFGRLLITWVFIGGAIVIINQLLQRKCEDVWYKDACFYTVVILSVGATAAVSLWGSNRLVYNFLILAGMLVVSLFFVWVVSSDSGLFAKRSQLVQMITVVMFAISCISLCTKTGVEIKISPDEHGAIMLDISTKREDREIEIVEYYWLPDYLHLDENQEGFPKEKQLDDKIIPKQDGRLRVVVTDNYGVQTEQIYWVHNNQYSH